MTLPLKSSRNEQRSVIVFFVGRKKINASQIHSETHAVYSTSALQNEQFTFGVRNSQMGRNLYYIPGCNQSFFSGMDLSLIHI